jgi:hypothetical protein
VHLPVTSRTSERPRTTFWQATKVLPGERKSDTSKFRILRFFYCVAELGFKGALAANAAMGKPYDASQTTALPFASEAAAKTAVRTEVNQRAEADTPIAV